MPIEVTTPAPGGAPQALDPVATAARLGAVGQEAEIGELITQATADVETIVGLRLWYREYREKREGYDQESLSLSARPLVAITSVARGDSSPLVEGEDFEAWKVEYFLDRESCWPSGRPFWEVNFFAGWWLPSMGPDPEDPDPTGALRLKDDRPDIAGAIFDMVKFRWQTKNLDRSLKRREQGPLAEWEFFSPKEINGVEIPSTSSRVLESLIPLIPCG